VVFLAGVAATGEAGAASFEKGVIPMLMRCTRPRMCFLIMAAVMMFGLSGCERQEAVPPAPEQPTAAPEEPVEPAAAAPAEETAEPEPKAPAEPAAPEPKVEEPETEPEPVAEPAEPEPAEGDTVLDPVTKMKALPLLVAADKFDGKEDKIIARCASCALGMDGKKEHSLEFMDYTFHFCTADCRKKFGEDLVKSVLALKIPED
jgi:hypothetical protein